MDNLTKTCTNKECLIKEHQSLDNFYRDKIKKLGRQDNCKVCSDRGRKARIDRDRVAYAKSRNNHYVKNKEALKLTAVSNKYNITKDEYIKLKTDQKNVCRMCRKPETRFREDTKTLHALSVDHCHETGKVRGLLCNRCNRVLGMFGDDPELAFSAFIYLRETKPNKIVRV